MCSGRTGSSGSGTGAANRAPAAGPSRSTWCCLDTLRLEHTHTHRGYGLLHALTHKPGNPAPHPERWSSRPGSAWSQEGGHVSSENRITDSGNSLNQVPTLVAMTTKHLRQDLHHHKMDYGPGLPLVVGCSTRWRLHFVGGLRTRKCSVNVLSGTLSHLCRRTERYIAARRGGGASTCSDAPAWLFRSEGARRSPGATGSRGVRRWRCMASRGRRASGGRRPLWSSSSRSRAFGGERRRNGSESLTSNNTRHCVSNADMD